MYTSKGSVKNRRKYFVSWALSRALLTYPKTLVCLFIVLLTTTATVLVLWAKFTNPVTIAERSYGVVVDAGSSSSKVHLFQWPPHDGDPDKLLTIKPLMDELGDPRIKKVEPGIATFSKSPETAFTSIQPLLEFALSHVPASHHQHTLLYIFCTAGMRLLSKAEQDRIVQVISAKVTETYPFHLPKDGVQVISGKLEGVFSWITINYLLGRLNPEHQHVADTPPEAESSGNATPPHTINTVGSLDMGGASLQVAFEIPSNVEVSPDATVDINLGCGLHTTGSKHKHRVFVSTYLGYGSNEARSRYYKQLLRDHIEKTNQSHLDSATHLHSLRDPCAPLESTENLTADGHSIKIRGLGDFRGCKKALLPLLQTSRERGGSGVRWRVPCVDSDPNCNLIQAFQRPPFTLKFESLDFYGTSEFWYTMRDVLRIGGHYTAFSFEKSATSYCQTNWKVLLDRFLKKLYIYADYYRLKSQCMKSAWLSLVLHEGLGFPKDSISLHSTASMEGQSVQWALGALLYSTRYLPLREVQLYQQLQAPPLSRWEEMYLSSSSSFLLPFLMVLCVASLLVCCRHRRRREPHSGNSSQHVQDGLHRSQSLNSLLRVHRRMSSITGASHSSVQVAGLDGSSQDTEYTRAASSSLLGLGSGFTRSGSKLKFVV